MSTGNRGSQNYVKTTKNLPMNFNNNQSINQIYRTPIKIAPPFNQIDTKRNTRVNKNNDLGRQSDLVLEHSVAYVLRVHNICLAYLGQRPLCLTGFANLVNLDKFFIDVSPNKYNLYLAFSKFVSDIYLVIVSNCSLFRNGFIRNLYPHHSSWRNHGVEDTIRQHYHLSVQKNTIC